MTPFNENRRRLSPFVFAFAVALAFCGRTAPAWSNHDQVRSEIRQFHDFLRDHPKVSTELRSNPKLVSSKNYLAKHDDLEKFLKRHPNVKRELINHPSHIFANNYHPDQTSWSHPH